jgi:hypothetical protein
VTDDLIKKELQAALDVWKELAEWVHNTSKPHEIGLHCAEVVRDRIKAQAAEIDRLREAGKKLHDHATHDDDCRIVTHGSFYPTACTCGYSDAWKAWHAALGEGND